MSYTGKGHGKQYPPGKVCHVELKTILWNAITGNEKYCTEREAFAIMVWRRKFEFVGLVNSDFMNFKRCTGYKLAHLFH